MQASGNPVPRTDDPGRWVGVGRSLDADPRTAAGRAATEALDGRSPGLALVFCSAVLDHEAVLAGVRAVVPPDTVIAGCTTSGEVAPGGEGLEALGQAPGVVVTALGGPDFEVSSAVALGASEHRRESGAEAATAVDVITRPNRALIMLADGLSREQHEIVRGAYGVAGALTPIVGGCSSDDGEYRHTYQFLGTGRSVEVVQDAVVGIGLGSSGPMGIGVAHGWRKSGDAMLVTRSEGGVIRTLDDEPAAQVWAARIADGPVPLDEVRRLSTEDQAAFRQLVFRNPLGLSRRAGEDLRVVHGIDFEVGSLRCLADVPQGALAWPMTTDPDSLIAAAAASCDSAVEALDGAQPLGFLVFDCGARRMKLGPDGIRAEQEAIGKLAGGKPFGGFYTYGEIGRTQGARGMHHLTVVTMALA